MPAAQPNDTESRASAAPAGAAHAGGASPPGSGGDPNVAQRHVEVVRGTYEAFGRGDIPALLELLTEDVEWTLQGPPEIPFAGTARGRAAVAAFFARVAETIEFLRFEPRQFVARGDTVVVLGYERNRIKSTGRTFEQEWAHTYTLRDGKIARGRFFEDTAAYVAALAA